MTLDRRTGWLTLVLLFCLSIYAIAEDITLTTYYPSPRGVYQELRTQGDVGIGDITNPPGARLHVTQPGAAPALQVDDEAAPDPTPLVIDQDGNVGIGTPTPLPLMKLHVVGSTLSTRNTYVQSPLAPNITVGVGELQSAIADWPGATLYGLGWDNSNGNIGALIPGGTTFGFYGNGGSGLAHVYVSGDAGIGTTTPQSPAPNGQPGNLDANDVYVRAANGGAGEWVSAGSQFGFGGAFTTLSGGGCLYPNPYTIPAGCSCPPGFISKKMMDSYTGVSSGQDLFICFR